MSLESNGVDRVRSLWKIPTRLHGTNICTSLANFKLCSNTTNCPKCTQIVRNAPKHEARVQRVDRVRSLRKIPTRLCGTNSCTSGPFCTECCRAKKGPKCTQIVWNTPKHEVRVQKGVSGAFVAKNSDTTSWHELLHHFGPFCTEFCMATKQSQMQPNSTKHTKIWV